MSIFQFERILIAFFVVLVISIAGVGGYLWHVESQGIPVPEAETPTDIAIMEGTYGCVPRIDETSTSECLPAIKMGGEFYALDLTQVIEAGGTLNLRVGEPVTVGGIFVPIEEISTNEWEVYRIQGIMKVEELTRE